MSESQTSSRSTASLDPGNEQKQLEKKGGLVESLAPIGGLVAVVGGLAALVLIALVAMGVAHADSSSVSAIATAAFGVVGSVVGAYFGVKVGSDGTTKAVERLNEQATRAQVFAAHIPPEKAGVALARAQGEIVDEPESPSESSPAD